MKSGIQRVGGRNPINYKYAGQAHSSGVKFTRQGFPNFSPHAKASVDLRGLTGNLTKDAAMANKAIGISRTPNGFIWHHVENGTTMQLVPAKIHQAVGHTGGAAVIRHGGN